MAAVAESNPCSTCTKPSAKFLCVGCDRYFCSKHFKEHEQKLSTKFDHEIVKSHDELLDQLQKLEKSNYLSSDLFAQIEEWRKATIDKVDKAAERARQELTELLDKQKITIAKQLEPITKEIHSRRDEDDFVESDIHRLRQQINEIQRSIQQLIRKDTTKIIIVDNDKIDWNRLIYAQGEQQKLSVPFLRSENVNANVKWIQNGVTVAGGNEHGNDMNQLYHPWGLCVDDDQTIYIAEYSNHRIMEWKPGATSGRVVAGGNGQGNHHDQLNYPTDVILDKENDSLIICDYNNKRVVRWPRQNGTTGETIISNIGCLGLTMDDDGFVYIVDHDEHEVRRYRMGENHGTVVAGGNGPGDRLDQLDYPRYVFVDRDHSVYVSEYTNHRLVKWVEGAKQGIVVAGGHGQGHGLTELSNPYGVVVDQTGTVYVADFSNNRIMRWTQGATHGSVIVGGNGHGSQSNQLHGPIGLSFDREGNLYRAYYSFKQLIEE
ncbi:unnamed protein product [Rotaria sp. Silwood1]|nr:unnamed protein product [Rotaria sp. Silwood1]CAF3565088.1 unnamed protein product [Rotaria sp. Silwood1]CAF3601225.1 unnamed protein product [Rotaria sp. Silwood1]CAF3632882.1 unnamed protein product [Rotaria sp. Silwood1]CAF4544723.1 unnamed protein product [Rotaria sp. Silwood1]